MALSTAEELDFKVRGLLCDSVVAAEGKLYIQGAGWTSIFSGAFPARIPRLGVGAVISVPFGQTNKQHTMTIRMENGDGQPHALGAQQKPNLATGELEVEQIFNAQSQFNVGRPPMLQGGEEQTIPFAMNVDGIMFAEPGTYAVVIEIDAHEVERLTFRIIPAQMGGVQFG